MSKRLITDRDVVEGLAGDPILLDASTLITPSARDRAVLLGIAIVEPGTAPTTTHAAPRETAPTCSSCGGQAHTTPCASSASRACSACGGSTPTGRCSRCAPCPTASAPETRATDACVCGGARGQPDGSWLVRVEGGRVVSVLPMTGAGQMTRARTRMDP